MYAALRYTTQMSKQMCNLVTLGSGSFSWSLRQVFQSKTMHTDGPYIQVSLSLSFFQTYTHTRCAAWYTHMHSGLHQVPPCCSSIFFKCQTSKIFNFTNHCETNSSDFCQNRLFSYIFCTFPPFFTK